MSNDYGYAGNGINSAAAATTVTGPDAFGASAVVGTSAKYARQDHDHGLPLNNSINVTAKSTGSPYTVLAADELLVITTGSSADYTVDLPAANGSGRKIVVVKIDSGANKVIVTPNGTDAIDANGNASVNVTAQWGKLGLIDAALGTWIDLGTGGV